MEVEKYLINDINKVFLKYVRRFYILPISKVLGIMVVLIMIWIILRMLRKSKCSIWKYFNIVLHVRPAHMRCYTVAMVKKSHQALYD